MTGETPPTHDILPVPEGLDPATLEFVLSHLASVAMDFELSPQQNQLDPADSESIDNFIHNLEEHIRTSQRKAEEKELALGMLNNLVNFYLRALEQARNPWL